MKRKHLSNGTTAFVLATATIIAQTNRARSQSVKDAPLLQHTQQSQEAEAFRAFNPAWRVWLRLIEEYTSCDKFPALSGVTSALQKLTGDACLAGTWKSFFLQGLLWRLQDPNWDEYVFFPKTPH
ncbi:hypothetical protein HBH89_249140 [Parastagonospora nodorum]|nr:hypothetical protein HBH89_249140 [Parastagonospora nodorum]KAH4540656.1 hypothetical protein HBH86_172270 [Parastagonospora nodorum]